MSHFSQIEEFAFDFVFWKPEQLLHTESNIGALGDRVCLRKNAIQWQIVETMYVQDAQVKNIPVECAHDEGHWLWVWG